MWPVWRDFFGAPRAGAPADASCRRPTGAELERYGVNSPGVRRIVQMVRSQLEAAALPQPRQWHAYRAFIVGYIAALADLQACNGGKRAQGPESRALSLSVLSVLCGEPAADALVIEAAEPGFRFTEEFELGGRSALDDYDRWSRRAMSGIECFIDASRREAMTLEAQPEVELGDTPGVAVAASYG